MSSGKAAGGGLIAVLAMGVAHGADDCARVGARAGRTLGDDALRGSRAIGAAGELGVGTRFAGHADELALSGKMNWGPAPRLGRQAAAVGGDDVLDAARLRAASEVEGGRLIELAPDGVDLAVEGIPLFDADDERVDFTALALEATIDAPVLVVDPSNRPQLDEALEAEGEGHTVGVVSMGFAESGAMILGSGERVDLLDLHGECADRAVRCIAITCKPDAEHCIEDVEAAWHMAASRPGTETFFETLYADLAEVDGWVLSRPHRTTDERMVAVFVSTG